MNMDSIENRIQYNSNDDVMTYYVTNTMTHPHSFARQTI
jgi:hypothetical protein